MDIGKSCSHRALNLGVESVEDIIDVENEMGFGEGEDWGHEEIGYAKLALKRAPQSRGQHVRSRSSPPANYRRVIRSTDDDSQRKPKLLPASAKSSHHEIHHDPTFLVDETMGVAAKKGIFKLQDNEEQQWKDDRHHCYDNDNVLDSGMDTDFNSYSPRSIRNEDVVRGERDDMEDSNEERALRKSCDEAIHNKTDSDIMQEKPSASNRVRFSLDLETAERVMDYVKSKGNENSTLRDKGRPTQKEHPWRYGRAAPVESPGNVREKGTPVGASKAVCAQRRREPIIREIMKNPSIDLERSIEMREDKKTIRLANERIERFEEAFLRQQEIAANMRMSLASSQEGTKDFAKLRHLVDAMEKNLRKLNISKSRHVSESLQLKNRCDQIDRLKSQCNLLEADRDRLRKKLKLAVEMSKGRERELETTATEREKVLERRVRDLEKSLHDWESKFRKIETEFAAEKGSWEETLSECRQDWKNQKQRWATRLKEKETELARMKATAESLIEFLVSCCESVGRLKKEAAAHAQNLVDRDTVKRIVHDDAVERDGKMSPKLEKDGLGMVHRIQADIECVTSLLAQASSAMRGKHHSHSKALREESQILEDKVSRTLQLMDELKQEMKKKEDQIKKENEKYNHVVAEKVREVEALENQLTEKEKDIEKFVQELKDEVGLLNRELARERSERSRLVDAQGDMKHKLIKGLRKKEQEKEEELQLLKEKVEQMRATIAMKEEKIESLEKEVKEKVSLLLQEKHKWNMAIKEVKQKAARTILRFAHGKENGLLEHLRERRRAHKQADEGSHRTDAHEEDHCVHGSSKASMRDQYQGEKNHHHMRTIGHEEADSPQESKLHSCNRDLSKYEDLGKSLESHRPKIKSDRELLKRKEKIFAHAYRVEDHDLGRGESEMPEKNREKQEVLKLLRREKCYGDHNTFILLQEAVRHYE